MNLRSREKRQLRQTLQETTKLERHTRDELALIANLLSDVDPVTGQVQLDSITFAEIYELFLRLNGDSTVLPARSYVHSLWNDVVRLNGQICDKRSE